MLSGVNLLPVLATFVALIQGLQFGDRHVLNRSVAFGLLAWLIILMLLLPSRHNNISELDYVLAGAVVLLGMGVVPFAAFYAVGRALRPRAQRAMVAWLVGLIPLYAYLLVVKLLAAALTGEFGN